MTIWSPGMLAVCTSSRNWEIVAGGGWKTISQMWRRKEGPKLGEVRRVIHVGKDKGSYTIALTLEGYHPENWYDAKLFEPILPADQDFIDQMKNIMRKRAKR